MLAKAAVAMVLPFLVLALLSTPTGMNPKLWLVMLTQMAL